MMMNWTMFSDDELCCLFYGLRSILVMMMNSVVSDDDELGR